ncbi:MAG: NAD(+)/NADH kinase [Ruminococcaceae bacterium]|nr:NAD(+)/NADH kinase [Oscillospiraceae bacterium]
MKIALISNPEKDKGFEVSSRIVEYLTSKGAVVLSDSFVGCSVFTKIDDAINECDFIITVGGDGTILKVVKSAYAYDKPILGINMGTTGYMASMEPTEYFKLDALFSGEYSIQYRSVLNISAGNENRTICKDVIALNDAVISHGNWTQIMNINLYCNGQEITSYRADGLIFSTPTGSTAYSLSAGGPIIDTELETIAVTPICAHSFNGRSILFKDSSVLEAASTPGRGNVGYLTIDGLDNFQLEADDVVQVRLAEKKIKTITFDNDSFYNILSKKIK